MQAPVPMAIWDTGAAVPSKGLLQIKTVDGGSSAKANKHSIPGTQRKAARAKETEERKQCSKEQGPPRLEASRNLQQRGPQGAKVQDTRAAGVEHLQELPVIEAFRSKRARSKGRQGRKLPRDYRSKDIQVQGREKHGLPGLRASESFQQQRHPGERKKGAKADGVTESLRAFSSKGLQGQDS